MSKDRKGILEGGILGFAIGDAIGASNEFSKSPTEYTDFPTTRSKGNVPVYGYTDETQQLIVAAESICENRGLANIINLSEKLTTLVTSGEIRSLGRTTRQAITNLSSGVSPLKSGVDHKQANGSLGVFRLVPYSLISATYVATFKLNPKTIRRVVGITHAHKISAQYGELLNYYLQEMVNGTNVEGVTRQIIHENSFLNKKIRQKLARTLELSLKPFSAETATSIGLGGFIEHIAFFNIIHGFISYFYQT